MPSLALDPPTAAATAVTRGALPATRPWPYTPADFARVRRLIRTRAGISLGAGKADMVYGRLSRRLRATGAASFRAYLDILEAGDGPEWEAFVNALTTNVTAFFREAHHFRILRSHLLAAPQRAWPLNIWCSAAASGEEAWSIAMTAVETFDTPRPPVRILATDVNTDALAQAMAAVYPLGAVERLPAARKQRFLERGTGARRGQCRIKPALRPLVRFAPLNLLHAEWPVRGPLSAIFCRNVMIYFDRDTQYRVLKRMAPLLARDGLLFAGHSESFLHAADLVTPCGQTVYRATRRAPPP
ncbi:MAG TPA: CheR family methyltransferase [Burkholderiaceae bacterium]